MDYLHFPFLNKQAFWRRFGDNWNNNLCKLMVIRDVRELDDRSL